MIIKVLRYQEFDKNSIEGGSLRSLVKEDVYCDIDSYSHETSYDKNDKMSSKLFTAIDKNGFHLFFDLMEVTIYVMNNDGKTIDKYIKYEPKLESKWLIVDQGGVEIK